MASYGLKMQKNREDSRSHPSSVERRRSARLLAKTSPAPTPSTPPYSERRLWSETHGTFWLSRTTLHRNAQRACSRRQPVAPPSIGRLDLEAPSTPFSINVRRGLNSLHDSRDMALVDSMHSVPDAGIRIQSAASLANTIHTLYNGSSAQDSRYLSEDKSLIEMREHKYPSSSERTHFHCHHLAVDKVPSSAVEGLSQGSDLRRSAHLIDKASPVPPLHTPSDTENGTWSKTHGTFWLSRTTAHRSGQLSSNRRQPTRPPLQPFNNPNARATHTPVPSKIHRLEERQPWSANCFAVGLKPGSRRPNRSSPPSSPLSSATAQTPIRCLWINGNLRAPSTSQVRPIHTAADLSGKPDPISTPVPKKSVLQPQKPTADAPTERVKRTVTFDTPLRTPLADAFKTSRIPTAKNGRPLSRRPRP
ncbi:unnamed protein product [Schistocephalus solidus]|uniref:Uncharacterized protein n=1 Tax=Schistocephalus solidus TaxID=70667 RepID=A0A183T7Z6_SCHSO|nr:unnamed protein product [Schistocephalus solidus]